MAKQRKTFDPSVKLEVVRMIKEQGLSVQNVSESMGIGPTARQPFRLIRGAASFCLTDFV